MEYRREVDGLRAVAVVPVVLFHADVAGFAGGYVGVDVFFVISGYLITTLIVSDLEDGRFSIAEFYARRARRILPALITVVAACIPLAWMWMSPSRLRQFAESVTSVGLFVSNLFFAGEEGYFASAAEQQPLLHTWSLAVEEQYYLVFPLLMAAAWRFARRWVPALVGLAAAGSFVAAEWSTRNPDEGIFFLPHLRAWELLIGSLTALFLYRRRRLGGQLGAAAALVGLALIGVAVISFDSGTPFPSRWALLPTLGAGLVILGGAETNLAGQLLSRSPLVGIGLVSYSAYLWHFPLFAFARLRSRDAPPTWTLVALGGVSMGLAWLTWRFVENPCRDRQRIPRRRALQLGAAVSVVLVIGGIVGQVGDGFPGRLNTEQIAVSERLDLALDDSRFDDGACRFSTSALGDDFVARFDLCVEQFGPAVIVAGDSHGTDVFNALAVNARSPFVVGVTKGFCRLHSDLERCPYRDLRRFLDARSTDVKALLYTQKGSYFLEEAIRLPVNVGYVDAVVEWLDGLDYRGEVLWIGPRMEPGIDLRNLNPMVHDVVPGDAARELAVLRDVDEEIAAANRAAGIDYVSTIDLVDYRFERDFVVDGSYSYSDGDHWSPLGERRFGARLFRDPRIQRLLAGE